VCVCARACVLKARLTRSGVKVAAVVPACGRKGWGGGRGKELLQTQEGGCERVALGAADGGARCSEPELSARSITCVSYTVHA